MEKKKHFKILFLEHPCFGYMMKGAWKSILKNFFKEWQKWDKKWHKTNNNIKPKQKQKQERTRNNKWEKKETGIKSFLTSVPLPNCGFKLMFEKIPFLFILFSQLFSHSFFLVFLISFLHFLK